MCSSKFSSDRIHKETDFQVSEVQLTPGIGWLMGTLRDQAKEKDLIKIRFKKCNAAYMNNKYCLCCYGCNEGRSG